MGNVGTVSMRMSAIKMYDFNFLVKFGLPILLIGGLVVGLILLYLYNPWLFHGDTKID